MKRTELFEPPMVTVIELRMSQSILAGSVNSNAETGGQVVDNDYGDFSGGSWDYDL